MKTTVSDFYQLTNDDSEQVFLMRHRDTLVEIFSIFLIDENQFRISYAYSSGEEMDKLFTGDDNIEIYDKEKEIQYTTKIFFVGFEVIQSGVKSSFGHTTMDFKIDSQKINCVDSYDKILSMVIAALCESLKVSEEKIKLTALTPMN